MLGFAKAAEAEKGGVKPNIPLSRPVARLNPTYPYSVDQIWNCCQRHELEKLI